MIARSNREWPQVRFLAEPKSVFLVLIGKSQESACLITVELNYIVKYDASKHLYLTSSVKHNTFSADLPPITLVIYFFKI